MQNLDITLRMILACEAEAVSYSIDQALVLPILKIVLEGIAGHIEDAQITNNLEEVIKGKIKDDQFVAFVEFYHSIVNKVIFYLDMVDEIKEGVL